MRPGGGVTRNTLRQQIADALRDEVLAGRLPAGREFTVKQIAEQYGVSATPVREALFDLSAQGLLVSDQHRGFQVREFSVADYRSMVEARALVVEGVFRGADGHTAPRGDAMASIRRRATEAVRAAQAGDVAVLIGYDLRFWRELGAFVLNPYISAFLTKLRVQAWVFAVHRLRGDSDRGLWLWLGHEELAQAISDRDRERVRTIMRGYYETAMRWADALEAAEAAASGAGAASASAQLPGTPSPGSGAPESAADAPESGGASESGGAPESPTG
ncbi:GntR family transcriptional regulator [uncultured Streptomyces sp.]|uniref:GntR family transcriptional regulator n=1 Tax=uncultured Streptomyces sp. TaxID=174707 RepID=UPI002620AEC1|nr:GntR family transcriptional regulator [uncultured Streptomyces sp.]